MEMKFTPKPCAQCGTTFTPIYPAHKFCSDECKAGWTRLRDRRYDEGKRADPQEPRMSITITCLRCGNEFRRLGKRGSLPSYCSLACKNAVRNETLRKQRQETSSMRPKKQRPKKPRNACLVCGQVCRSIGANYCSWECEQVAHKKNTVRVCKQCGAQFLPKMVDRVSFCSRACSALFNSHARGGVSPTCKGCGQKFITKRNGATADYCSQCVSDRKERLVACSMCGKDFIPRTNMQMMCSDECRAEIAKAQAKAYGATKRTEHQARERQCPECDMLFTPEYGHSHRAFCSDACGKRYHARIAKRVRIARAHAVAYESVDLFAVFKRDGWRCYICGVETPRKLRGTHHDCAPELDHVVPLAHGGSHTYGNVACACRKCNQIKSDRPISEMVKLASGQLVRR